MLDIRQFREDPEHVRKRLATRGLEFSDKVDNVLNLDTERREAITAVEELKAKRNSASKEIGLLMSQKKIEEAEAKKAEVREIGIEISQLDTKASQTEEELKNILLRLPNLPHADVPIGASEDDNKEINKWGEKPSFDFDPKPHTEICETLGLVDFARGAKLSGSGFLLYSGWGARLERALIQYLLDTHIHENGYTEVSPPFIVGYDCMIGVGQFPKFEDQAYMVQEGLDEDSRGKMYLIPTAEAPVANIHREEILKNEELPKYYCAYSPCFRAEAGAAGVGTRGMIRVHQFDKVELIKIVKPENSYDELNKMLNNAEKILQSLNLHYRILQLCTADMSFGSATTYDIEVWAPGQGDYLEVSSCSNCEDYQARRMNLRYKDAEGKNRHPHILNGSGTALARLFVALIETYQQPDGSILIPEPLQNYLRTDRIPAN
ncbi:MAG: serine--tRNA ligase [Verrucomicrobiales bacterium]|nr:serine--tRNA ligase [Verrucomicrobiales bacterium]